MPPLLRPARDGDIDALIVFWQLAGENDARPGDSREAVERLIEHDSESLLIAEDAGEIVGTVIAGWDGWRAHLYRLAVHPARRRQGIGALLLDAAEARQVGVAGPRLSAADGVGAVGEARGHRHDLT